MHDTGLVGAYDSHQKVGAALGEVRGQDISFPERRVVLAVVDAAHDGGIRIEGDGGINSRVVHAVFEINDDEVVVRRYQLER